MSSNANGTQRIDWTRMAMMDDISVRLGIKLISRRFGRDVGEHELELLAAEKSAEAPKPLDDEAYGLKSFEPSETANKTVIFDYHEQGDGGTHVESMTISERWHNAMMHVEPKQNAEESYHSIPQWQWFDDE